MTMNPNAAPALPHPASCRPPPLHASLPQALLEAASQREAAATWREDEAQEASRQSEQRADAAEERATQLAARLTEHERAAAAEADRLRQQLSEAQASSERASMDSGQLRRELAEICARLVRGRRRLASHPWARGFGVGTGS